MAMGYASQLIGAKLATGNQVAWWRPVSLARRTRGSGVTTDFAYDSVPRLTLISHKKPDGIRGEFGGHNTQLLIPRVRRGMMICQG